MHEAAALIRATILHPQERSCSQPPPELLFNDRLVWAAEPLRAHMLLPLGVDVSVEVAVTMVEWNLPARRCETAHAAV